MPIECTSKPLQRELADSIIRYSSVDDLRILLACGASPDDPVTQGSYTVKKKKKNYFFCVEHLTMSCYFRFKTIALRRLAALRWSRSFSLGQRLRRQRSRRLWLYCSSSQRRAWLFGYYEFVVWIPGMRFLCFHVCVCDLVKMVANFRPRWTLQKRTAIMLCAMNRCVWQLKMAITRRLALCWNTEPILTLVISSARKSISSLPWTHNF